MYKTDAYGLFMAQLTLPYGKEEDFIHYEIENLFAAYRKNVMATCSPDEESSATIFQQALYRPKVYGLLGSFDLAVLALVDDFGLATRHFHPFNALIEEGLAEQVDREEPYEACNYTFNVTSGVCPDPQFMDPTARPLLDTARTTFLGDHSVDYPFIGITSLKLNNGLLIGNGGRLMEVVLRAVYATLNEPVAHAKMAFILMHSFSWHELTIVFFSDRLDAIKDQVFKLRRLNVEQMVELTQDKDVPAAVVESLKAKALLATMPNTEQKSLDKAHLFVHTNTVFGYDFALFSDLEAHEDRLQQAAQLHVRWDIKPGHLPLFLEEIEPFLPEKMDERQKRITAGRGDFAFQLEHNSIYHYLSMMRQVMQSSLIDHVRKISTVAEFELTPAEAANSLFRSEEHYFFHKELGQFRFPTKTIAELRKGLKRLGIPKVLRERVTNMFVTYNDGIFDTVLYGYFIELRPFLETVLHYQQDFTDFPEPLPEMVDALEHTVQAFEAGYKNRFGQSYIMNDISDLNIDFNGGIHQLLTAYDGAYKCLTAFLGEGDNRSIAYVAGGTSTQSDHLSVSLNYFHLFQPIFFAGAATHEAANFYFSRRGLPTNDWLELEQDGNATDAVQNALRYFFTDAVSFYLAYNCDFQLFFFWHWAFFIQTTLVYDENGTINEELLEEFIARMYLVDYLCNNTAGHFDSNALPEWVKVPDDMRAAWTSAYDQVFPTIYRATIDHIHTLEPLLRRAIGLVTEEFAGGVGELDHPDRKVFEKTLLEEKELGQKIFFEPQPFGPLAEEGQSTANRTLQHINNARVVFQQHIAEQIRQAFSQGETYSFGQMKQNPCLSYANPSFYYHALFYAYLQGMYELCEGKCELLERHPDHGTAITKGRSPILFDPLGGIFSTRYQSRVQYYQRRVLFLKSLWNLSTRQKVALFK